MADDESTYSAPDVEPLRRQRAQKRGAVTRLSKKLAGLTSQPLAELTLSSVKSLLRQFKLEFQSHDSIQDRIDDALANDPDALDAEFAEREKHGDLHSDLSIYFKQTEDLIDRINAYSAGHSLLLLLRSFTNQSVCPPVISQFQSALSDYKALSATYTPFQSVPELADLFSRVSTAVSKASDHIASAPPAPSAAASPAPATPSARPNRIAHLSVDLPKFDGNPLNWSHFENLFNSTLRNRADTFCNADKRSLLANAIVAKEGQEILRTDTEDDTPVKDLLEMLRDHFGRAEVVVPLLMKEVLALPIIRDTYDGLRGLITRLVKGNASLKTHIGDSLSEFLCYLPLLLGTLGGGGANSRPFLMKLGI